MGDILPYYIQNDIQISVGAHSDIKDDYERKKAIQKDRNSQIDGSEIDFKLAILNAAKRANFY